MKYILVEGQSPKELNAAVNEYLKNGYILYGSPTATAVAGVGYATGNTISAWSYCQAVVKEQ